MLMNAERLYARMKQVGLDAIVATMPENVTYSSGFWAMSQWIRRGPQAYVLTPLPDVGEPAIIASTGIIDLATDDDVWIKDVRRYGHFAIDQVPDIEVSAHDARIASVLKHPDDSDAITSLVRAIKDRKLESACIGVDEIGILPQYWDKLVDALPDAKFVRAADVFRYARAIKTQEEVRRLRTSAQIAEKSISAALSAARAGVTEAEFARIFHNTTINEGGIPVLCCIGFGPRSAMTNVQASNYGLRGGEIIRFDVGGRYQHYRADIARNGVLGQPSKTVSQYHKAICVGLERAIEMIKPGVRAADVFQAAVDTVQREGLPHYKRNHVGHGIGLDGYDAPNIAPSSQDVFEEGMVVCVETPYYEIGLGGLQVEDTLVVTKDGVDSFMLTGTELRIV
jgi:Xaa-Pro dipeptidase